MAIYLDGPAGRRVQLRGYVWLAVAITALTGILAGFGDAPYRRFLGPVHPVLAVSVAALLGLGALAFLMARAGFRVYRSDDRRGLVVAPALAAAFGVAMILVDAAAPLPADINVAFPASVLFYPTIAFVVEAVFHLLPLALAVAAVTGRTGRLDQGPTVWVMLTLVAMLEPAYQAVLAEPGTPTWETAYIAVHIFGINLAQLWIFRRYDFVSMYLFRLTYYALWHVAWGHLRLDLLF